MLLCSGSRVVVRRPAAAGTRTRRRRRPVGDQNTSTRRDEDERATVNEHTSFLYLNSGDEGDI